MKNNIFNQLETVRKRKGFVNIALVDPDRKNHSHLDSILNNIIDLKFDAVLVGGSLFMDGDFENRINYIKEKINLPLILFPNSSSDICKNVDAVLYLTLLSSQYPQYLVGEHVKSSSTIKTFNLECIPTAYILIEGQRRSTVEIISYSNPIPPDKIDLLEAYALTAQYLGNKLIYFEMGSGSSDFIDSNIVKHIKSCIDIPIMIGGGIKSKDDIERLVQAGASYIVSGTMIEKMSMK